MKMKKNFLFTRIECTHVEKEEKNQNKKFLVKIKKCENIN